MTPFAEGRLAGLHGQRVEMNPYSPDSQNHSDWIEGWREGIWEMSKRRIAA